MNQTKVEAWASEVLDLLEQYHKDLSYVSRMTGFTYAVDRAPKIQELAAELRAKYNEAIRDVARPA